MAEVSFKLADTTTVTPVGEHFLLVLRDGLWKIDSIWRITRFGHALGANGQSRTTGTKRPHEQSGFATGPRSGL